MKVVAYLRVSTDKQGASGLGLEGQEAAIQSYAAASGASIVGRYVEVESGRDDNRPEMAKALAHARRAKATLVVAKMDRLSRSVLFLAKLLESGVEFVACDNPHANRMTVQILAAVAENEARQISERTKAALAAYKARGGKLGGDLPQCRNLTGEARMKGGKANGLASKERAKEAYSDLIPMMQEWRAGGMSLGAIADRLSENGHTTRNDSKWTAVQVMRALKRVAIS